MSVRVIVAASRSSSAIARSVRTLGWGVVVMGLVGVLSAQSVEAAAGRWTTHGPFGLRAFAVAVSPSDPSVVYAGIPQTGESDFGRGLYKSVDGGRRWALLTALTHRNVTVVAVAPTSSDVVYLGTTIGVSVSMDGGATWLENWHESNPYVESIAIDPTNPSIAYAGACCPGEPPDSQLYKTTNGGVTWTDISNNLFFCPEGLAVDPTSPQSVYVGTCEGVYKSTDGGQTWDLSNNGLGTALTINELVMDPQSPNTLYAAAQDEADPVNTGMYKTVDGAANWTRVDAPPLSQFPYITAISVDPSDSSVIDVAGETAVNGDPGGVFESDDGGQTWHARSFGLFDFSVDDLSIAPVTGRVFAATGAGLFVSPDPGSPWTVSSRGMFGSDIGALVVDPTHPSTLYAGTAAAGVFRSPNGGRSWVAARNGLPGGHKILSLAVDPLAPTTLYAGTLGNGVYKSTNSGASWAHLNGSGFGEIDAVAVDAVTEGVAYAGNPDALYKSENGGDTWAVSLAGPFDFFYDVVTDPVTAGIVYASTNTGVFKSVDAGTTWVPLTNGLDGPQNTLAIDPSSHLIVYAGGDGRFNLAAVFKSTDGGSTWAPSGLGLEDQVVNDLAVGPAGPTVYAATGGGVYRSKDGGGSWTPLNQGLPDDAVERLAVDGVTGAVHAGMGETGVFDFLP